MEHFRSDYSQMNETYPCLKSLWTLGQLKQEPSPNWSSASIYNRDNSYYDSNRDPSMIRGNNWGSISSVQSQNDITCTSV